VGGREARPVRRSGWMLGGKRKRKQREGKNGEGKKGYALLGCGTIEGDAEERRVGIKGKRGEKNRSAHLVLSDNGRPYRAGRGTKCTPERQERERRVREGIVARSHRLGQEESETEKYIKRGVPAYAPNFPIAAPPAQAQATGTRTKKKKEERSGKKRKTKRNGRKTGGGAVMSSRNYLRHSHRREERNWRRRKTGKRGEEEGEKV